MLVGGDRDLAADPLVTLPLRGISKGLPAVYVNRRQAPRREGP